MPRKPRPQFTPDTLRGRLDNLNAISTAVAELHAIGMAAWMAMRLREQMPTAAWVLSEVDYGENGDKLTVSSIRAADGEVLYPTGKPWPDITTAEGELLYDLDYYLVGLRGDAPRRFGFVEGIAAAGLPFATVEETERDEEGDRPSRWFVLDVDKVLAECGEFLRVDQEVIVHADAQGIRLAVTRTEQ